jgi:predicted transcriptional regulator
MPKTVTLRLDDETYRSFVRRAKSDDRALANFIEKAVKQHIRESDFADDTETSEIVANQSLVRRMKRGSGDARRKLGNLAD